MIRIGNYFFRTRNRAFPLIMIALYCIAPPPHEIFHQVHWEHVKDIIALVLAFSGLAMRGMVIGYAYIKRGGLNKQVYAENLVTAGMFSLCRNPLYFGNMLIYVGVFLLHGDPIVMVTGIALYLFIYQSIIYAEEAYLRQKFGSGYDAYCADVPRWIPQIAKFHAVTQGMRFNLRRAIMKDYSTITTTVIALTLTEAYEYAALPDASLYRNYFLTLAAIILVTLVWAASIRIVKKRAVYAH